MNIRIIREKSLPEHLVDTGGEYAVCWVDIYIDETLPIRTQRILAIHSVIENYCRSWEHNKVEELVGFIEEVLDKLEVK